MIETKKNKNELHFFAFKVIIKLLNGKQKAKFIALDLDKNELHVLKYNLQVSSLAYCIRSRAAPDWRTLTTPSEHRWTFEFWW